MNTIQSVLIVTLCLSFGSCDVPGTLVGFSRITSRAAPSCLNSYLPVCADCQTLLKCQNSDDSPKVVCKTQYPDRPYCSNGACTAEAPGDCIAPFRCTDAGYYPNPLNCSRYHLCSGAGAEGPGVATYECPSGFVYNPLTTMCKLSASPSDCATIDCSADPIGYVLYPADNKFFASCDPGEEPLVLKCPQDNVYVPSEYRCVFKCPREGRIADPLDKTKFYECYFDGSTYFSQSLQCVDTYEFSAAIQQCFKPATPPIG